MTAPTVGDARTRQVVLLPDGTTARLLGLSSSGLATVMFANGRVTTTRGPLQLAPEGTSHPRDLPDEARRLSSTAIKALVALSDGPAPAGVVADQLNLNSRKTYRVLRRLIHLGLVAIEPGRPAVYRLTVKFVPLRSR